MKLFINKIDVKKIQQVGENLVRAESLNKLTYSGGQGGKQVNWKNLIPSYVAQCQNI